MGRAYAAHDVRVDCVPRSGARQETDVVRRSGQRLQRDLAGLIMLDRTRRYNVESGETSLRQPLPAARLLDDDVPAHSALRALARVVIAPFMGAPADPHDASARTGITGCAPDEKRLRRTCELLEPEYTLYPAPFLTAIGARTTLLLATIRHVGCS